jgi:hypothetical protein
MGQFTLSSNNCSITLSSTNPSVRYGQHKNLDWGVEGPVYIISSTPEPVSSLPRHKHGMMININPSSVLAGQGFDTSQAYSTYTSSFNIAISSSPYYSNPSTGKYDSIVKMYSIANPQQLSGVTYYYSDCMVLTVYESSRYPADISDIITPPQGIALVQPTYNLSFSANVDQSVLRNFDLSTGYSNPLTDSQLYSILEKVSKVQFDHGSGWAADFLHASGHMRSYSRDFQWDWGKALLVANSIHRTDQLVANVVRLGHDQFWDYRNGKSNGSDGGEANGRMCPIIFAGNLINNQAMKELSGLDLGMGPSRDQRNLFGELGNIFRVMPSDVGRFSLYINGSYVASDVGIAEWGIRHYYLNSPVEDNRNWEPVDQGGYRRCCTTINWIPQMLAIKTQGLYTSALVPGLSPSGTTGPASIELIAEYIDRYITTENGAPYNGAYSPAAQDQEWWIALKNDLPSGGGGGQTQSRYVIFIR